mmetsp:Transcript_82063/g.133143  ORF Transcript_82063/g.133143 Transcript_82063/m.133143 type:complete len:118 (+) Transcript_82063:172-525(+)
MIVSGDWFLSLISIKSPLLFSIARVRVRVLLHFRGFCLYPASFFPFLLFSIILEAPVIRRKHLFEISRHLCLFINSEGTIFPIGAMRHFQQVGHHLTTEIKGVTLPRRHRMQQQRLL